MLQRRRVGETKSSTPPSTLYKRSHQHCKAAQQHSDDEPQQHGAAQPVDAAAAAQFDAILEKLALRVADAGVKPSWKPDSFFKRFAAGA